MRVIRNALTQWTFVLVLLTTHITAFLPQSEADAVGGDTGVIPSLDGDEDDEFGNRHSIRSRGSRSSGSVQNVSNPQSADLFAPYRRQLKSCHSRNSDGKPYQLFNFRSIDGSKENINAAAGAALLRLVKDANYVDGISEMPDGPNPRHISNMVFDQKYSIKNEGRLTDMCWLWGQFLDHDMSLTEHSAENGFHFIEFEDEMLGDGINFTRSHVFPGSGENTQKELPNDITAYIDGSMVYGSTKEVAESLRTFKEGRLKVETHEDGDMLPPDPDEEGMFLAGDKRANENTALTAMHTLFVREHNRLADKIAEKHGGSDEDIFQKARKILGAEVQKITYHEFLPTLVGDYAPSDEEYKGYDKDINPAISVEFSTAAFRVGHTMLSRELPLHSMDIMVQSSHVLLEEAFFQPGKIRETPGIIDQLLHGLSKSTCEKIDAKIIDSVRNMLFPQAGGIDLATLNIQRGRDHGLPGYNEMREAVGLRRHENFEHITSDPTLQKALKDAYGKTDNIDAWVGCLAEDHATSAHVGPLVAYTLENQFTRLRDGDPYFYLNDPDLDDLCDIIDMEEVTLSKIITSNTVYNKIPSNVFQHSPGDDDYEDKV